MCDENIIEKNSLDGKEREQKLNATEIGGE